MAVHLMGAREIEGRLGVSRRQVRRLVGRGDWPLPFDCLAMGRVWRRTDVERWIARHRPALAVPPPGGAAAGAVPAAAGGDFPAVSVAQPGAALPLGAALPPGAAFPPDVVLPGATSPPGGADMPGGADVPGSVDKRVPGDVPDGDDKPGMEDLSGSGGDAEAPALRRPADAELLAHVDWRARLAASTIDFQKRRSATRTARRLAAERRRHGMDSRNARRQMLLDARAAQPPGDLPRE